MMIYYMVNIFSMKNNKSSRKLRVGVNWYPGVNWSTTTTCAVYLYFMPIKLACIYFNQFSKCKQTFNIT